MSDVMVGALTMLGCVVLIQTGMHIGVALMFLSFAGVFAIKGIEVAGKLLARSAATSIASDAYAVIPLFVLMGLFVSATAMGRDTFDVAALVLKRLRGGLAMATVGANAVFAACTGTSIASASIFTKIAVPEMVRHGHTTEFSVGVVAGSSVLGMLIPPSILFIIFGVIANVSIGDLFTSGILPGIRALDRVLHHHLAALLPSPRVRVRRAEQEARRIPGTVRGQAGLVRRLEVHAHLRADRHRSRGHLWRILHADRGGRRRCVGRVPHRALSPRADRQDFLGGGAGNRARDRCDLFPADGSADVFADVDIVGPALRGRPVAAIVRTELHRSS